MPLPSIQPTGRTRVRKRLFRKPVVEAEIAHRGMIGGTTLTWQRIEPETKPTSDRQG